MIVHSNNCCQELCDPYLDFERLIRERRRANRLKEGLNQRVGNKGVSPFNVACIGRVDRRQALPPHVGIGSTNLVNLRNIQTHAIATSKSCVRLCPTIRNYEIKSIQFNMLLSFHGLALKDSLSFIQECTLPYKHSHFLVSCKKIWGCSAFHKDLKIKQRFGWLTNPREFLIVGKRCTIGSWWNTTHPKRW